MTRATRADWAKRVQRWRASGLKAREFGEREGLNPSTLRWWSSQLRGARPRGFVEVKATTPAEPAVAAGVIEVVARDNLRIRVSGDFDSAVLRRVVAALEVR